MNTIRIYIAFATISLAALALPTRDAIAQAGPGPGPGSTDRLQQSLDAKYRMLDRVWKEQWDRYRRTRDERVRALLEQARQKLNKVRELHARYISDPVDAAETSALLGQASFHLEAAERLIRAAEQLLRALSTPGTPPQPVRESLRGAEAILDRIHHHGRPGPQAEQVQRLVDEAREAEARGQHEMAVRLANAAMERGRMAWRDAMRDRVMSQRGQALETVVEPVVGRALRLAVEHDDEQMVAVARRAEEHLTLARELNPETQSTARVRLFESARREAELVIRTLDQAGFARHRAERAIAEADAALQRARDVGGDGNEPTELLHQGETLLEGARSTLVAGDPGEATRLAERARELARRVVQDSLGSVSPETVAEALAQTDRLIEQAAATVDSAPDAVALLDSARERQSEARNLLAAGEFRPALAQTRIAARLALRARELSD